MSYSYGAHPGDFIDPEYGESLPELDEKYAIQIRHGFVRKVYGILLTQVALTTALGALFTFNESLRLWIATAGTPLLIVATLAALASVCLLGCVPGFAEKTPGNYVTLGVFTIGEAISLGAAGAVTAIRYNSSVVLEAYILTAVIVTGLTLFAFQTSYDFTGWGGKLSVILLAFIGFSIIRVFFPTSPVLQAIFAACGAVIFALYLLMDTQRLIGKPGKRLSVSEDQYIMVAISLYLDIVNLFLELLRLMSALEDKNSS